MLKLRFVSNFSDEGMQATTPAPVNLPTGYFARVQLLHFYNPDDRLYNGQLCDDLRFGMSSTCDPVFNVTYRWGNG